VIESLRGIVESCSVDAAVVRVGNICLKLGVTSETVHTLQPGAAAELFTHLYMREDVLALYGFGTREERSLFEELMGVTGVGPKAALGFLSTFTPSALREAIEQEDVARLIRVPGVGRKTAQRVILELKGKLERVGSAAPAGPVLAQDQELLQVLTGLGYSAAEASEALSHSSSTTEGSDEDRLRAALRYFAGR